MNYCFPFLPSSCSPSTPWGCKTPHWGWISSCTINPCHTVCSVPVPSRLWLQLRGHRMGEAIPVVAAEVFGKQQGRCCPTARAVPTSPCPSASQSSIPAPPKSLLRAQKRMFAGLKPEPKERNLDYSVFRHQRLFLGSLSSAQLC